MTYRGQQTGLGGQPLAKEVSLLRTAYGAWAMGNLGDCRYMSMYSRGEEDPLASPPRVSFEFYGIRTDVPHVSEFDVIGVPRGYALAYAENGECRLFDPEGNVCSVRCDSIESDVFTVSSPMGSFETGVVGGLKTAWCTRGRRPWTDGGLRNLPLDHGRLCSGECAGEPRLFCPPLYDWRRAEMGADLDGSFARYLGVADRAKMATDAAGRTARGGEPRRADAAGRGVGHAI